MYEVIMLLLLGWYSALITYSAEDQLLNINLSGSSMYEVTYLCPNNITEKTCPKGTIHDTLCKCGYGDDLDDIIKCNEDGSISAVLDCHCATSDKERSVTQVGACIYNCVYFTKGSADNVYLSLNTSKKKGAHICKDFNRAGALCGECLPEYYHLAYSYNLTCVNCTHVGWNWGRYIMAAYLPLTLFCLFIFFFQINAVTGHLHPVIWYSQAVSMPAMARTMLLIRSKYLPIMQAMSSLFGIWNLDFFRPFYSDICLEIDFLPTLALDYVIAVYPLLLMAIIYLLMKLYDRNYRVIILMWRPFRAFFIFFRKNWNIRTSVIDSCVTFFFLANVKFLSVTFDLLTPAHLYELQDGSSIVNKTSTVLFYASNTKYFGKEHLPYAILAIIVSIIFIFLPILLLALYPFAFFQRFLNCIPVHWHILHTFMDSFTGCYKDGTEPGTRDCRWFAAVFFLVRLLGFFIYSFTHTSIYFPLSAFFLLLLVLLIVNVQPFKAPLAHYLKINATFFTLLAFHYLTISGLNIATIKVRNFVSVFYILAGFTGVFPLLYTLIIIVYWIISRRKFTLKFTSKVRFWRNEYDSLDENDTILFECAR